MNDAAQQERLREIMPQLVALGFPKNPQLWFNGDFVTMRGTANGKRFDGSGKTVAEAAEDVLKQIKAISEHV